MTVLDSVLEAQDHAEAHDRANAQPKEQALPLPALREDIRLVPDARTGSKPTWLIHDPVRDSFTQIGLEAFQLMTSWTGCADAAELARAVEAGHGRMPTRDEIAGFIRFLEQSRLTLEPAGGWRAIAAAQASQKSGVLRKALHHYLFFKLPLVAPDAFLRATLPAMRRLAAPAAIAAWLIVALAGLYLVLRGWSAFTGDIARQMTLSGAMLFAVTLFMMKIVHEAGHAYVATAMGCRVRSAGIAVMLMAPMLYTDVTDAWRLPSRWRRMAIDLAGIGAEMTVAGIALLAWAVIPPGPGREIAAIVATSAIAMTVAVNLNPFMRFDGYYVFADLIGVQNLQSRAFALCKWRLREILFGFGSECPDTLRGGKRRLVIAYGFATMAYRVVLFTGIAVLVYHMAFKILGILLFAVEIGVFIALPVWRELKVWWRMRALMARSPRGLVTASVGIALVLGATIPWSTRVSLPALLEPASHARLYASAAARIVEVRARQGDRVTAGDVLVVMESPRLEKERGVATARLALTEARIARRIGDAKDQTATLPLEKDRLALLEKVTALDNQIAALAIRAPIDGRIAELDPDLAPGRLVSREDEIGVIFGERNAILRGYADQQDLWRLKTGATGRFIADDASLAALAVSLGQIAPAASPTIEIAQLSELHSGRVRTYPPGPRTGLVPIDPIHLLVLMPKDTIKPPPRPVRGLVVLEGTPESLVAGLWRQVLKVLVQESGA